MFMHPQTYYYMYTGGASSSQYTVSVHRPNPLDVGAVAVLLTAVQGRHLWGTLQRVRFRTLQRVWNLPSASRGCHLTLCTSVWCVSYEVFTRRSGPIVFDTLQREGLMALQRVLEGSRLATCVYLSCGIHREHARTA